MDILAGRCRHDDQKGEQEMALHGADDGGPDDKEKNCMVETLKTEQRTGYSIVQIWVFCGGELYLRHNNVANMEGCCFRESCTFSSKG